MSSTGKGPGTTNGAFDTSAVPSRMAATQKLWEESKDEEEDEHNEQEWNTDVKNYVFEDDDGAS